MTAVAVLSILGDNSNLMEFIRVFFLLFVLFSLIISLTYMLFQENTRKNILTVLPKILRGNNARKPKLMLDWTGFFGHPLKNDKYMSDCPLRKECLLINNKSRWLEADAIVFHGRDLNWNNIPLSRTYNQRYVFFIQESPVNGAMVLNKIHKFFNWSMTYRSDSDIFRPHGMVAFGPNKQSNGIYPILPPNNFLKTKKGLIIWLVSNCLTKSRRELIASELKKHIAIDIYGKCGNETSCPPGGKCEKEIIDSFYKFYIAFENSICKDYITEKYWGRWNYNSVPIVLKREIYENMVPADSFIAVDDFKNAKQLTDYLKYLDKNDTAYMEYFKWRTQGYYQPRWNSVGYRVGFCGLCDKLINDNIPKVYENMQTWFLDQSHCDGGFAVNWVKN